ncbi:MULTISPECIES: peptide chain release factor 2 [Bacillaceae]|uniref:peptide chain release factor 2 n=1 Tax=Anoxybacillaceae TaxID=3120669 RepID=UPI000BE42093|nr:MULTISPECIES: peptide chain release factor 2 [Bacillaceae]NNU92522.1 peptide chain release factor 2 [Geobacillus sp. NFOSA3]PDM41726.1 peptide chain release factor 2 [Parageobacillus yumthangensis]TXK92034.1 peptide chain release factor 2 [Parageobacillus sp. SY1]MED4968238.1 peptide chain release factor 2 [Parageobacillus toebii]PUF90205.1 peptide chain release factor 2 [Geobacillus sp. LYN3]
MDLIEIKQELEKMAKRLAEIRGSLDLETKQARIRELEEQMAAPNFWDDQKAAQTVINEANALKDLVGEFQSLEERFENLEVTYELIKEEPDEDLQQELVAEAKKLTKDFSEFELQLLLNEPYDKNNAILELHPGAGGTESQDWASMLLRMYTRWAEKKGFKVETLDYLPGEEAGVKSVTLLIKGHNAYGYLKAEKGVHRLVRISPFDASGRRHTSFVSCEVMPEMDDDIEIEIRPEEIKVDTYRSSGAGGQHVNTTDSAVRITHIPTGIVVTCQSERSQIKNREKAMNMLKAKLYQKKLEEQQAELAEIRGEQKEIGWGNQIRSYVFHPYSLVKDHRTNVEVGNVQAVMDGEIDIFIDAYLRSKLK